MSIFKNSVNICGYIADDIKLQTAANGSNYCRFDVAVERPIEKKKVVDYIAVQTWDKLAVKFAKMFKKGDPVEVVGAWHNNVKQEGAAKKTYAVIMCAGFCPIICGGGGESGESKGVKT
jgi:single-stranded DNA-binding protein